MIEAHVLSFSLLKNCLNWVFTNVSIQLGISLRWLKVVLGEFVVMVLL